ncbi:hypothetical protein BCR36DRAFT_15934 [Piromyces finnis]|uniref:Uncharacterized protein n=1 Tax=Piromyces finnis TaxID=1754191 RepID=A0A1Y1VEC2_9FUNG|nr:hypothetical protein BCR36DRAFT_15934 [Piromyces finnis]|eukprot:ORX54206.1 hypothetical protein BCR36DRAFT_15934 [Piromyces finnis]
MTNSIQSLSVILQQLNRAAITVNQKITEYENTIQQKDEMFIRDQNSKEIEIDALKHKIRELTSALNQRLIANESEVQNREMETSNNESTKIVSNDALEKYKNDLVILNHNLSNVTLLFDTEIQQKSGLMKSQEQKINDLTERTAKLNTQLANITLLFDSEINIKNKIIKDKECQIEKLRKTTAELNHNLSVISLLSNEKDIANKRNVKDLMETISSLQTKWAAINSNLLTLTSTVNDQIRSKNEEIRLNRKDAVYYRDFSTQIYNQMMDYVGDFLQRIWNKNHENDILIEKNKNLIKYCTDLNGRIARFTLEINSLQNEKKMLMSRLADGTKVNSREISIQYPFVECREDTGLWWLFNKTQKVHEMQIQQPITECREDTGLWWLFSKEQVNDDQPSREIVSASDDDEKVEYYRNMAVDLNNRVAMLSLDIDSLKLNKYNEKEFSGEYKEIIEDKSTINFFKNQAVSLNSNLAKLTLEHNDFKNQELINKEKLIRNSEDKIEYYQQMAANLNTRLALLSLEMNNVTEDRNVTITDDEQSQYYENLIQSLTIKINDLLIENEELKAQQSEIQYTRDIPQNEVPINVVKDDSEINRFREIAVDLNSRLAKLSLEFNEKPKSVKNNNDEYIKKIQDQVIDLNQRLSVLTLNSNEEIKNLKRKLSQKEQGSFKNQVIDLNQRLAILTLSTNDEVNALKRKISQMQNNETSRKVSYEQSIVECRSDTGLWWLFSKPQTKQIKKNIIYNNERNIQNFQNEAINLNQRLAVLTLSSNDEINNLKKQLSEKDILIEELRSKLASMNRQIIDLTFNSNIENQQNKESTQRTIQIIDTPKSENIIQPLIKLPLAVDYLFEKPTTSSKSDNIIQPLIKLPLAVDYLFEQPKIGEILREVIPINDSTLIEELNNERIKNKELNIIIESMRKEMQSISEYLKETKSCATSLQNLNNAPTTTDNAEEIASLAEYLKETKISLEAYKNNSISEINSLAAYLKDTISMVKEYKANNPDCLDVYGNFNSMDDTFDKYENEKKYDSEETVENQQFGY